MAKYTHVGTQPLTYGAARPDQQIQPGTVFDPDTLDVTGEQIAFWLKIGAITSTDAAAAKAKK